MKNIVLVGNSNVGKTTLFNTITGDDAHVGNWAGVTVDIKQGKTDDFFVYDLPGIYSLDCFSMEEQTAKDFLLLHKNDFVVNVVECKNIARNLYLTLQMIELGLKPIVVVNMCDVAEKSGGRFFASKLQKRLGVPVFVVDATDKKSCLNLLNNLCTKTPLPLPYDKKSKNIAQKRYEYIDSFANEVLCFEQKQTWLEKLLFNKWFFVLSFILLFCFVFWFCFAKNGVGGCLSALTENAVICFKEWLQNVTSKTCPAWLSSFAVDVVAEGVGTVAKFLPQIVLLFFCLTLLEDTGYISYVAFFFDGIMSKIGLDGKSVFTFLLCFGCNTSALATSKNLCDKNVQKSVLIVSPFLPCSAKMPVFLTILAFASPALGGLHMLVVLCLYLVCIAVALSVAKLLHMVDEKQNGNFVLEVFALRLPSVKRVGKTLYKNTKEFVSRLAGTLFLCIVVIWLLKSFSFDGRFLMDDIQNSILATVGKKMSFLLAPIGLDDWRVCVSLLLGITAKEVVAGSLVLLFGYSFGGGFTALQTITFLVFVALYMPCVSTVAVIKKEGGTKTALTSVLLSTGVAYIVCFVFYSFGLAFAQNVVFGFVACICLLFVAMSLGFVLKYKCKNCKGCKFENFTMQKK
ncbi:MAG: ferrous iron transporter B [Clostridia bacterium]|nr:ferrous iron transporter B [Clostridia bacterium]